MMNLSFGWFVNKNMLDTVVTLVLTQICILCPHCLCLVYAKFDAFWKKPEYAPLWHQAWNFLRLFYCQKIKHIFVDMLSEFGTKILKIDVAIIFYVVSILDGFGINLSSSEGNIMDFCLMNLSFGWFGNKNMLDAVVI